MGSGLCRLVQVSLRQLAEQCYLGEVGAQIIVNIPGDARAFKLEGALLIEEFYPQPHFAPARVTHSCHQRANDEHKNTAPKPWRLPERRHHGDRQRNYRARPLARLGYGLDAELVLAGRQVRITSLPRATPTDAVHLVPLQDKRVVRVNGNG